MDKFEYNVRASEIKELIKEGHYAKAANLADTIDWRRVKSTRMLCTISDVYKINRRYVESRDILLYAYERNPNGRLILYYLCELSIKLGDVVSAIEYYKHFAQIAPKDASQFILLYKIYEAQDVSLEERMDVLEELKRRDYKEKWAFELAYLYHLVGQTSLCIDECNEIFLWFGKGKYVTKALELKQLHTELSDDQAARLYESQQMETQYEPDYMDGVDYYAESDNDESELGEDSADDVFQVFDDSEIKEIPPVNNEWGDEDTSGWERISRFDEIFIADGMNEATYENDVSGAMEGEADGESHTDEMDIRIRPVDVSEYNTINLQQEIAENMKALLSAEDAKKTDFVPLKDFTGQLPSTADLIMENASSEEVFFGDTGDLENQAVAAEIKTDQVSQQSKEESFLSEASYNDENPVILSEMSADESGQIELELKAEMKKGITETGVIKAFNKSSTFDEILSQGYDGQISLVVPDEQKVERQITGQLKIDDILTEWERQKKEIEQKRKAEVRSKIQEQTATLFNDFDTQTKMGLLEKLEKAMVDAAIKAGPSIIKVADIGSDGKVNEPLVKEPEDEEVRRLLDAPDVDFEDISDDESLDEEVVIDETITDADVDSEADNPKAELQAMEEQVAVKQVVEDQESKEPANEDAATITAKQEKPIEAKPEPKAEPASPHDVREFTADEKVRFGRFVQHKKTRRQLVAILDRIKEFDGVHHLVVTGEEGLANMKVVKGIIKEVKNKSGELHGKVVKISGGVLNKKGVSAAFSHITSGVIIIEHAADLKKTSIADLIKLANDPENKLMFILEDNRSAVDELLSNEVELNQVFTRRVDLNALDNQTLVEYAKNYAFEQEYSIDEFGILALHTRIAEMQTSDHEVTTGEVEEIIEEAMYYADRKNPKHFFDILAGKRYDEEDMIVLREKDFLH